MIRNGKSLLEAAPIKDMLDGKQRSGGVTYGLGEGGYDIRILQEVEFTYERNNRIVRVWQDDENHSATLGNFTLASSMEYFEMPTDLLGIVHDKSTWARQGLSVFNTVLEPGFRGGLTLELVYHGQTELIIPAGAGIAQVVFHQLSQKASYSGKYQDQSSAPEPARFE